MSCIENNMDIKSAFYLMSAKDMSIVHHILFINVHIVCSFHHEGRIQPITMAMYLKSSDKRDCILKNAVLKQDLYLF